MYYEELDWATRAKGHYTLAFAPQSIVYHKEGGSIGSSSEGAKKSRLADYYGVRNRLLYTRKHAPEALPSVYLGLLITVANPGAAQAVGTHPDDLWSRPQRVTG